MEEFSKHFVKTTSPIWLDRAGHDTHLMGPKIVMLHSFMVNLLDVDTSAQTFWLKLMLNMDWKDDSTIKTKVKQKRNLGRTGAAAMPLDGSMIKKFGPGILGGSTSSLGSMRSHSSHGRLANTYKTGKCILGKEFWEDPLDITWNPEVVLVNAAADKYPIEAGLKLHSVDVLSGRPMVIHDILYQPKCWCAFTFSNFSFEETNLGQVQL